MTFVSSYLLLCRLTLKATSLVLLPPYTRARVPGCTYTPLFPLACQCERRSLSVWSVHAPKPSIFLRNAILLTPVASTLLIPISTLIIYAQFYVRYKILREGVSRYVNLFTAYQKNSRWNGISPALQVFRTRHLAGRQVVVMTTLWRAKDALDGQEWFVTVLLNKLNYACTLVGLAWKCFNLKVISHYEGRNRRKALGTSVTFGECSEISTHDLSLCSSDERTF